ncbi:MAG: ATP-binding protein [Pseudomonadota bacterium]|nr:ATP-binding protein [Pseudomonadota bacterium]
MRWLEESLNKKFAVGTAAGLLVSSLAFLVLFVGLYREQLERERSVAAAQVTRLLQTSLENAMLKRDLEGLKGIVGRLGNEAGIYGVMISNPQGEIRFASDPERLGEYIPPDLDIRAQPVTQFLDDADGQNLLRSVNPVGNKPPCQECHGPIEQNPVNGILYVDFDSGPILAQARKTTFALMGSGSIIVLINLAGGWWFIRRYVIRPVEHLSNVSLRLSNGDLGARTALTGKDELAVLGGRFNHMAATLEEKMEELRDKEYFLQELVDAVPDGIRVIDPDYRVVLANATYRDQLGLEGDVTGPDLCYSVAHARESPCPETLITCPLKEIARSGKPLRVVHRHHRTDGGKLDVELYAAPMRVISKGEPRLLVVESIRDLQQEVKFSHEQKLSELGRLAAGVAHEIHNPLAAVRLALHAAEQANAEAPPDHAQVSEYLGLVDQEVEKCREVTERLLKLSVPPPEQQELVVVERVIDDTLKLLQWEAQTRSVDIRLVTEGTPLRVLASDSELRMVTLNLVQNALHAMPRGGSLTVRCGREGGGVAISFEDTGVGINANDRLRMFEPFFSRRADGIRGTGLGLSITKSIVEKHDGSILVDSEPGHGSRITVTFPDADSEEAEG